MQLHVQGVYIRLTDSIFLCFLMIVSHFSLLFTINFYSVSHSVEITEIYSHIFLTRISWKQRSLLIKLRNSWFHEFFFGESEFFVIFPHCASLTIWHGLMLRSWFSMVYIKCGITISIGNRDYTRHFFGFHSWSFHKYVK